jgi:tetratricopeptide (TPR) repeat protein
MANEDNSDLTTFEIDAIARRGDLQQAMGLAVEMIKKGDPDNELYFVASEIAFQLGDLEKAEQLINSLLVLDPQHLRGWCLFGEICIRKNRIIGADHARRTAETLFPALVSSDVFPADPDQEGNTNEHVNGRDKSLNFDTLTFADICLSQGYHHKALKIYQDHSKKNPGDEELKKKIADI